MKINRAIGLGIALLVLQFMASGIWYALESTVITGFDVAETTLSAVGTSLEDGLPNLIPQLPITN